MKGYPALNKPIKRIKISLILVLLAGCTMQNNELKTVEYIDVNRFMGDWYVIANIPTYFEKNAYNPLESYRLDEDGSIATTFSFNAGSFDGEQKVFRPRAFVTDLVSNAVWGMQFVWPIKADYRIVYLDDNYQQTIIGRTSRDYVWIMARTPTISEQDYSNLVARVDSLGYDLNALQKAIHK